MTARPSGTPPVAITRVPCSLLGPAAGDCLHRFTAVSYLLFPERLIGGAQQSLAAGSSAQTPTTEQFPGHTISQEPAPRFWLAIWRLHRVCGYDYQAGPCSHCQLDAQGSAVAIVIRALDVR